jgi:hypothetical protein
MFNNAPLALRRTGAHDEDIADWQKEARRRLHSLLMLSPADATDAKRPRVIASDALITADCLTLETVYLETAECRTVPITLLTRADAGSANTPGPPLLLQTGSATGVHLAWGEVRSASDAQRLRKFGADIGRQAALRGWSVLCVEQYGLGDRAERRRLPLTPGLKTGDAFSAGLLLGRSLVGERVFDLMAVVDWLKVGAPGLPAAANLDLAELTVFGHSSGGTTALYAAAADPRIRACVASGCLGFIRETIAQRRNGEGDAVVPGILAWFEMDDILSLIAPRHLLAISGTRDHIWPADGGRAVVDAAHPAWQAFGSSAHLVASRVEGGHRPYPAETFEAMARLLPWEPGPERTIGAPCPNR